MMNDINPPDLDFSHFTEVFLKRNTLSDDVFFTTLREEIKQQDAARKKAAIDQASTENYFAARRGTQTLDAGYIFAPYIPITIDLVADPTSSVNARLAPEAIQELEQQHNINAEEELSRMLSNEVNFEIAKEQLSEMLALPALEEETKPKVKGFYFYDRYVNRPKQNAKFNSRFVFTSPGIYFRETDSDIRYDTDYETKYVERSIPDVSFVDKAYVDRVNKNGRVYEREALKDYQEEILSRYATTKIDKRFYGTFKQNIDKMKVVFDVETSPINPFVGKQTTPP